MGLPIRVLIAWAQRINHCDDPEGANRCNLVFGPIGNVEQRSFLDLAVFAQAHDEKKTEQKTAPGAPSSAMSVDRPRRL